jgi:hypothetical protein
VFAKKRALSPVLWKTLFIRKLMKKNLQWIKMFEGYTTKAKREGMTAIAFIALVNFTPWKDGVMKTFPLWTLSQAVRALFLSTARTYRIPILLFLIFAVATW